MKTTRRDFLKGLFATGATLAVAPHLLVELVHGASDLTPQERDVAAEVMGLRTRQWSGLDRGASVGGMLIPEEYRNRVVDALAKEQEILYGVPGGEMPVGIIKMNPDGRPMAGQISPCTNMGPSNREQATAHVKFTEEEVVWKRRSIIVPVPEPTLWPDGSLRFGQMEVPFLDSGEPDWDYVTRAMRELEGQTGDRVVAARWVEEDRGLYEYGT